MFKGLKGASAALVLCLCVNAALVFGGLTQNKNMWAWIVLYWAILTVKNTCDYLAYLKTKQKGKQ